MVTSAFASTILKLIYGMDIVEEDCSYLLKLWPLLAQRLGNQGHSLLICFLLWNSSLHGSRVPDGRKRPSTGGKSVDSLYTGLGIELRSNWWDKLHWSWAKFSYSEQREGTAEPSIAVSLIEKLPDETPPDRTEEETRARKICAVAFFGEFVPCH